MNLVPDSPTISDDLGADLGASAEGLLVTIVQPSTHAESEARRSAREWLLKQVQRTSPTNPTSPPSPDVHPRPHR